MDKLEIFETEKRKPSAVFNGFQYRIHRTNKESVISWACVYEKTQKCKGRMTTKDSVVIRVSEHLCKPDVALTEVKKHVSNAKKRVREDEQAVTKIYREELGQLFTRGYEFVTDVPQFSSIKSSLYRGRQRAFGSMGEAINAQDIELSDDLLRMDDGFNFLLVDDGEEDRILAFASQKARETLANSKVFFMDGTFKSCSKQFAQIYTIHADIGSTKEETKVIPAVFALLPNKKQQTYERLFRLVKERVAGWNPELVILDFEVGAILPLKKIFSSVEITGCNFHFNQSLWRKIQELGLVNDYKNDDEIRLHLRMCAALAFLPMEKIDDGWLCIQEHSPSHHKLKEFYDYYVDQWLQNSAITVDMWNCNERRHRTNNVVEGWNHKLNSLLRKPHPKIAELVRCLKGEASHCDFLHDRACLNLEGKKRKRITIQLDERINSTMSAFRSTGDIRKCLQSLAYIQKFQ